MPALAFLDGLGRGYSGRGFTVLFPTIDFAIFFVVVFAGSWLLRPHHTPWRLFILAASLFFYGYWDVRYVSLIVASIVGNHVVGVAIARSQRSEGSGWPRLWVTLGVTLNLAVLGFFKYYDFFATSLINLGDDLGLSLSPPLLDVILPVGISFFTFQALSYVIDIYRREIEPLSLLDFAVYLSFFPQLVAGPIVRATEFAPQLPTAAAPERLDASRAYRLIFAGLFKKVVISSYLATEIVDPVFAVPSQHSGLEILVAVYAYAIQIYADFSGYTDIAIGAALLLGFRFPQNFNAPYAALSVGDFWRRWHMTLSRWLRDYLYIPLGGNRRGSLLTYRNLALTMLLGGLWHGAAWTFVIWGAIHGALLIGERLAAAAWVRLGSPFRLPVGLRAPLGWLYTFHAVCFAWVFFRAESFGQATEMIGRMFSAAWQPAPLVTGVVLLAVVASLVSQLVPDRVMRAFDRGFGLTGPVVEGLALAVGLVLIDGLGPEGVAPFIYFQF